MTFLIVSNIVLALLLVLFVYRDVQNGTVKNYATFLEQRVTSLEAEAKAKTGLLVNKATTALATGVADAAKKF